MARTLARSAAKLFFFVLIMSAVMLLLVSPEKYFSRRLAERLAFLISGDVNAESLYDSYFYIDFITVISITVLIYHSTMKLIKKLRRK